MSVQSMVEDTELHYLKTKTEKLQDQVRMLREALLLTIEATDINLVHDYNLTKRQYEAKQLNKKVLIETGHV